MSPERPQGVPDLNKKKAFPGLKIPYKNKKVNR